MTNRTTRAACENSRPAFGFERLEELAPVPVHATFFNVRRGRDPFFKFFMKTVFPRRVHDWEEKFGDRKSTRLNSSHIQKSRMPSSA